MGRELEEQVARIAQQWGAAASPVSAAEARLRPSGVDDLDADAVVAPVRQLPQPARLNRWVWLATAAALVGLVVGVAALVREPSRRSISPATVDPTPAPGDTLPTTAATANPDETVVTTQVVDGQSLTALGVSAMATAGLATLESFSATATVHTTQRSLDDPTAVMAPESTTVNDITLMADGSLWIQGDTASWASYDATSGTSRGEFLSADGAVQYQEIVGWTDNSTPLLIAVGYNPVTPSNVFAGAAGPTVKEVVSALGRPAWRVTVSLGGTVTGGGFSQLETYTIDQESGLTVEYSRTSVNDGVEDVVKAQLSDLQTDAALPAEFPGAFPQDAVVDRSGNPDGFALLTPDAATEQFGSELLLPAPGDAEMRIVLSTSDGLAGEPAYPVTFLQLTVELRTGFAKTTVLISKTEVPPGSPVADPNTLVVGGSLCGTTDGVTCSVDSGSVITAGGLEGTPSVLEYSTISATTGAVQYVILAASAEEALAIANSFS